MQKEPKKRTLFTLLFYFNYIVFDMFRTTKCSSSGRLVHAVLWYQTQPDIDQTAYTDVWKCTSSDIVRKACAKYKGDRSDNIFR